MNTDSNRKLDCEGLAISPLDGRYYNKVSDLSYYFSEYALVKYRLQIEVEYFLYFNESILNYSDKSEEIQNIYIDFDMKDFNKIKEIEKKTNHDVKAVEYFLREKLEDLHVPLFNINFVHFGLTSHDINSPAMILQLRHAIERVVRPTLQGIHQTLLHFAKEWLNIYMLARTHGQYATPTSLGKEIQVYVQRLAAELRDFPTTWFAKMGGAVGNLNAHYVAYPNKDWPQFFQNFLHSKFNLRRYQATTQVGWFDDYAKVFHSLMRINTILIDFNRDIWTYISMNYFKLKIEKGEVGSSTMPHKVNPIQFENSEGNLLLANNMLQFFATQYPLSRMQRDLVNSTLWRNNGVGIGHCLLGYKNFLAGFKKLTPNLDIIGKELNSAWCILSEPIQIILKQNGVFDAYEIVKDKFRVSDKTTQEDYLNFVEELNVGDYVKKILRELTPLEYAKKHHIF